MTNMIQKRKHPRVSTDLNSEVKPARRTMFEARVLNFSEGGAFIETGERLYPGSELILCLTLTIKGKKKRCMVEGRVAWANHDRKKGSLGCGVAFHHVSKTMVQNFRTFVAECEGEGIDAFGRAEPPK